MKILIFDTETTGLPTEKNVSVLPTEKWPYIVQLSYLLYNSNTQKIETYVDSLIKIPQDIVITEDSVKIHKITKEMTQNKGIDIYNALKKFNTVLEEADIAVGHNISFDKNMIMVESIRNGISHNFMKSGVSKKEYCTMKNGTEWCKIIAYNRQNKSYFKYPKLNELYSKLFNQIPSGLHNSMVDVLICLRCYGKMTINMDYYENSEDVRDLFNQYSIDHILPPTKQKDRDNDVYNENKRNVKQKR